MMLTTLERPTSGSMTIEEFLDFLECCPEDERWELVSGRPVQLQLPTSIHQRIAVNLCWQLNAGFQSPDSQWYPYYGFHVFTPGLRTFLPRPDAVVAPSPATDEIMTDRYLAVGEVRAFTDSDQVLAHKLRQYCEHPGNRYCLIVNSECISLDLYACFEHWRPRSFNNPSDRVILEEFGVDFELGELYRGTVLNPSRR